jgi:predicted ATPase
MGAIGLASTIDARRINDTEIEIQVGRVAGSSDDLVSVADVGFGVSQVLPVLVSLLAAEENQIVYLEQPEIHLHPRAQAALADVLIAAAKRGVIVIAETHSSILLKAIQTRIAKGDLPAEQTRLHWFTRDPNTGETRVDSTQLDDRGRYGNWPEDFSDVELEVEDQFLSASDDAGA